MGDYKDNPIPDVIKALGNLEQNVKAGIQIAEEKSPEDSELLEDTKELLYWLNKAQDVFTKLDSRVHTIKKPDDSVLEIAGTVKAVIASLQYTTSVNNLHSQELYNGMAFMGMVESVWKKILKNY